MRRTILVAVAVALMLVALVPGARAAGCSDTWNGTSGGDWDVAGNWSAGVPAAGADVCITSGSAVLTGTGTPPAQLGALLVAGGGALTIDIHNPLVSSSTTIGAGSSVTLDGSYHGSNAGNASLGGGPVLNQGTITLEGTGYSATLYGTVTNQGTIDVPFGNVSLGEGGNGGSGSLVNEGTISIAAPSAANTGDQPGITSLGFPITNAGGTIANGDTFDVAGADGTTGSVTQGAGTTTGNPIHLARGTSLAYTGTGASSYIVGPCDAAVPMSGNLAAGQDLSVEIGTGVEESSSFSSAGTIVLDDTYQGSGCGETSILTDSGTFTNAGSITVQGGGSPFLTGTVVNDGTVAVVPGTTLVQQSGGFANAGTLEPEISSSGFGAFALDGGTTFTAGGTLAPALQGGFVPAVGQEYAVVKGASLSGRFASVSPPFGADYGTSGEIQARYGASAGSGGGGTTPPARRPVHVARLRGAGGVVALTLTCPAGGAACAAGNVRATVSERVGRRRRHTATVTVAAGRLVGLAAGRSRTVTLHLDALGRRLLARARRLSVTIVVTEGHTTIRRRVEVVAAAHRGRRHHRRRA